jgi:hypothetical protein
VINWDGPLGQTFTLLPKGFVCESILALRK